MEERLLFDRVQLQRADVTMRYQQLPAAVEAHAADAVEAVEDDATVTACEATQASVLKPFVELSFDRIGFEDFFQAARLRAHRHPPITRGSVCQTPRESIRFRRLPSCCVR